MKKILPSRLKPGMVFQGKTIRSAKITACGIVIKTQKSFINTIQIYYHILPPDTYYDVPEADGIEDWEFELTEPVYLLNEKDMIKKGINPMEVKLRLL